MISFPAILYRLGSLRPLEPINGVCGASKEA